MDVVSLLLGLLIGAAVGFLVARTRAAVRVAEADARAKSAGEKLVYVEEQLAERFQALSTRALDVNNVRFLELAETRLAATRAEAAGDLEQRRQAVEHLVEPLRDALARVETQLRDTESGQRAARAELAKEMEFVRHSHEQLRSQTMALVRALQRPEARGRWGEMQLRRVAEIAGMQRHCDFDEQVAEGPVRPDMVVRLAGGKNIVVDAKVSLAAYLEAAEAGDESLATVRLDAHARHVREHVDRLAAKSYWQAFAPTPEFVVLFIPGEAFLAPALERDPALLDYAMARRVHIATPTTLITMLRTAHYAWQQAALSENARAVFELGKELYERLSSMGRNVESLGRSLARTVEMYNKTVGSLESRVLVTARKLHDLGVVDGELDSPEMVEGVPRPLASPELLETTSLITHTNGKLANGSQ
ncbi:MULTISPECIES: DNA recombination protein RmuC [Nonomuraea]|uniref:DNA recombination protein RmuC n=2 Tax=Nonomuraea TaxID=83681 RepID=A0ABW1BV08_9ACTN|nr:MULTISPECIES: DNA recombination protein RmuC [Nonomuraea]MDA0645561.1 DNA recombination protein RmuC [Nonomuraea ferruginea]TXK38378.1 DNA recombination protein RmuC [Nonomuraea sp. C10]